MPSAPVWFRSWSSGATRSRAPTGRPPRKAQRIRAGGALAVELDLLDAAAVHKVSDAKPDAIVDEATALAGGGFSRNLDRTFVQTNRLRTQGTGTLIAAAREAGVERLVAQSLPRSVTPDTAGW